MKRIEDTIRERGGKHIGSVASGALGGGGGKAHLPGRLFNIAATLQPSSGKRPGRPTDPAWTKRPKVPMSQETLDRLERLAASESTPERKVTSMQVAARLLELSLQKHAV